MTKHTPGPWRVDMYEDYEEGTPLDILDSDNFPITVTQGSCVLNRWKERHPELNHWADGVDSGITTRERTQEELEANTRLISAAPEMLAALEMCQEYFKRRVNKLSKDAASHKHLVEIQRVLAKAKGETNETTSV